MIKPFISYQVPSAIWSSVKCSLSISIRPSKVHTYSPVSYRSISSTNTPLSFNLNEYIKTVKSLTDETRSFYLYYKITFSINTRLQIYEYLLSNRYFVQDTLTSAFIKHFLSMSDYYKNILMSMFKFNIMLDSFETTQFLKLEVPTSNSTSINVISPIGSLVPEDFLKSSETTLQATSSLVSTANTPLGDNIREFFVKYPHAAKLPMDLFISLNDILGKLTSNYAIPKINQRDHTFASVLFCIHNGVVKTNHFDVHIEVLSSFLYSFYSQHSLKIIEYISVLQKADTYIRQNRDNPKALNKEVSRLLSDLIRFLDTRRLISYDFRSKDSLKEAGDKGFDVVKYPFGILQSTEDSLKDIRISERQKFCNHVERVLTEFLIVLGHTAYKLNSNFGWLLKPKKEKTL